MAEDRRPPPIEVIESLTRDPDGLGADWRVVDGPWEFGPDRAVAYVSQPGPFRDSYKVEVTLHVSGAEREAAERYRRPDLPSIAEEFARMDALIGKPVTLRGEPALLTHATHLPHVGVKVQVQWTDPPPPERPDRPDTGDGWSLDVAAVEE